MKIGLFQKKKKLEEKHDEETPIVDTAEVPKPPKKVELTAEQKLIHQRFEQFSELRVYDPDTLASKPQAIRDSEMLNLLLANFGELKAIRELLEKAAEE